MAPWCRRAQVVHHLTVTEDPVDCGRCKSLMERFPS